MKPIGSVLQFVGGRIGAVAASGLFAGAFIVIVGVTPAQYAAAVLQHPPAWIVWAGPTMTLIGLGLIWASLRYNAWSQKQKAIDALAEDISFAIGDLVNRAISGPQDEAAFKVDYEAWCARVSKKLENRAFFTLADQLHFDRLGYITPVAMGAGGGANHTHSMLKLKFERLRDIINWSQERRR